MVPLALLWTGTASATTGVPNGGIPNYPTDNDSGYYYDYNDAVYADGGAFASDEGAGTFNVAAGTDGYNAWYAGGGAFAGDEGAGTFDVASGTDGTDAWYDSGATFAGDEGAATFNVASGTFDNNSYYASDGSYADDDEAGTFNTNSGTYYDQSWYDTGGTYAGDEGVGTYDNGHTSDVNQGGYYDNYDNGYYDTNNTWSSDMPDSDTGLVRPHSVKTVPDTPVAEQNVTTAPAVTEKPQTVPVHEAHGNGYLPRPTTVTAPIADPVVPFESHSVAGPHFAATHWVMNAGNWSSADELNTMADNGYVAAYPVGNLSHD